MVFILCKSLRLFSLRLKMNKLKTLIFSKNKVRLIIELIILFLFVPSIFAFDLFGIPLLLILTGTGLLVFLFLRFDPEFDNKIFWNWKKGKPHLKRILLLFGISAIVMTGLIYFIDKSRLFYLALNMPWLLLIISIFYPLFSVLPQSLIYRSFFFHRYKTLFKNEWLRIILSALFFSLGHSLYKNLMVLGLAFIAGIIYAYHYNKTKSLAMNWFEHSIYGIWLFASGLGTFFVSRFVE